MTEREIGPDELKRMLEGDEAIFVVDIRESEDYAPWHIHGSTNLPVYDALRDGDSRPLADASRDLPRDRPVVAVCKGGVISRRAAGILVELGFDASSLAGGMRGWTDVSSEAVIASRRPGVDVVQVRRNAKGCLSYVIGHGSQAVVVDPSAAIEAFRAVADREGRTITHVIETHVHADHISRARSLAQATGASLVLPRSDRVRFPYAAVADGETIHVGELNLQVIATPGHTAESVCYLVGEELLLSGDTLFTEAVGRPDLERGDAGAAAGARALYRSLKRLLTLADAVRFYPGHHSEPIALDGIPIGSTLGAARAWLETRLAAEDPFVTGILDSLGEKPGNHETLLAINEGRAALEAFDATELEAGPNRCAAG